MIDVSNTEVHGFESAIRGMRNPMNSWDKSDSKYKHDPATSVPVFTVGREDLELMKSLIRAGTDHSKFMRYITVTCDIVAPLFWWAEFDTYKVGTVRNSCSKMHKLHAEPLTAESFSADVSSTDPVVSVYFRYILSLAEELRNKFNVTKDRKYWRMLVEILPESYNQRATVMLNYQVLRSIYHARKHHKLSEWHTFCEWIETLPYSELITRTD